MHDIVRSEKKLKGIILVSVSKLIKCCAPKNDISNAFEAEDVFYYYYWTQDTAILQNGPTSY